MQRRSLAVVVGLVMQILHHQPGSYDPNGVCNNITNHSCDGCGSESRPNISVSVLKALLLGVLEEGEEKGMEDREGYYVGAISYISR